MKINELPTPCYVIDEKKLRKNLEILKKAKDDTGGKILLAQKAFSNFFEYPLIGQYLDGTTASGLFEAKLGYEKMGKENHVFAPAFKESEIGEITDICEHLVFNSFSQLEKYADFCKEKGVSIGIRVNPECSTQGEHAIYDPCAPGSRLGVTKEVFDCEIAAEPELFEALDGLHFHTLCESSSYDLEKTLGEVEKRFGRFLPHIKWLNMGGGHLMTRKGYDTEHLIGLLQAFKAKYPNLEIIMEPGSAFAWQTGFLLTTVVDIVENHGIKTAIIDASFTCHMPDCLEMPYKPVIRGAIEPEEGKPVYRIGGNSCLSGDYMGDWSFERPLKVGDKLIFEDMIHYTVVKTTMFNGIPHPSLALWSKEDRLVMYKEFGYEDYKGRMN